MSDELRVIVTAAVKDAMRDLKKVDKAVDDSAKKWAKAASGLQKIGSGMTRYLTLPIMGAAVAAVKFAADLEKQQIAFEVLLGDTKKAAGLFESLKKFAAVTRLQLEDITAGAQTLLAFGVASSDVEERLRMLGDVAMGDASKLDTLVNAYGKLRAKGVASLEEINRFTENGVPLLDELAKGFGVSTEQLLKFVSAGKVKFKDVDNAIRSLTTGTGQFAGMMDKMSQTTAGKFSTAMDNIKLSAAKLGESLLPIANSIIDKIGAAAEKFGNMDAGAQKAVLTLAAIAALAGPIAKTAGSLLQLGVNLTKVDWAKLLAILSNPAVAAIAGGAAVVGGAIAFGAGLDAAYTRKINEDPAFRRKAIAEDLYQADATLDVYMRIAESYDESLETVMKIAREEKLVTSELNAQYVALQEEQELRREKLEAAKARTGAGATAAPGGAAADAKRSWRLWLQDVTGQFDATKSGGELVEQWIAGMSAELARNKTVAEALGEQFDMGGALADQQEAVRAAMQEIFDIDPEQIDEPFELLDESVAGLILRYQEIGRWRKIYALQATEEVAAEAPMIASKSRLQELLEQEKAKLTEATALWEVYAQIQRELADPGLGTQQIALLSGVKAELEDLLGIRRESAAADAEATGSWSELADHAAEFAQSIASAAASGDDLAAAMANVIGSIASAATGIPAIGGIIGGIISTVKAVIGANQAEYTGGRDYESMIIDQEKEIADQRVELLKETLATEKELRDENLKKIEDYFNQEYEVLKDLWDRNLITTEEFVAKAAGLTAETEAATAAAEEPVDTAQAAIDAADAAEKALDDARRKKLSALATKAFGLQTELDAMSGWNKFWSGRDEEIVKALGQIDRRMKIVETAGTIEEIAAARRGADFVTSGPRMLMVGDNPGGREHVMVRPLGSQNRFGPDGGDVITFNFGNVYGIDDLAEKIEQARSRLDRRRRIPA